MKAAYSNYNAPNDGVGPFKALYTQAFDAEFLDTLKGMDGLILWGGSDISPSLYKEAPISYSGPREPSQRDVFEWSLIKEAVLHNIPIIGVCRGAQMLCAYVGGKLVQDVNNHHREHSLKTYDGEHFTTTSCHHQMMYPYEVDHELLGWNNDLLSNKYNPPEAAHCIAFDKRTIKEPEVVYFPQVRGFGVQGHPEWTNKNDLYTIWLIEQIRLKCYSKDNVDVCC